MSFVIIEILQPRDDDRDNKNGELTIKITDSWCDNGLKRWGGGGSNEGDGKTNGTQISARQFCRCCSVSLVWKYTNKSEIGIIDPWNRAWWMAHQLDGGMIG